ncbi:hypothetical protein C8R45DRAFT_1147413 [Mycena sanguinolenta]|nr:hypothetical protein C8R45DRAFT_1147413 [Mycena sanguinolenta]
MRLHEKSRRAQFLDVTTQIKLEEFPKGFEAQILQNLRDLKLLRAEGAEEDGGLSQRARRTWSWFVESCHADGLMAANFARLEMNNLRQCLRVIAPIWIHGRRRESRRYGRLDCRSHCYLDKMRAIVSVGGFMSLNGCEHVTGMNIIDQYGRYLVDYESNRENLATFDSSPESAATLCSEVQMKTVMPVPKRPIEKCSQFTWGQQCPASFTLPDICLDGHLPSTALAESGFYDSTVHSAMLRGLKSDPENGAWRENKGSKIEQIYEDDGRNEPRESIACGTGNEISDVDSTNWVVEGRMGVASEYGRVRVRGTRNFRFVIDRRKHEWSRKTESKEISHHAKDLDRPEASRQTCGHEGKIRYSWCETELLENRKKRRYMNAEKSRAKNRCTKEARSVGCQGREANSPQKRSWSTRNAGCDLAPTMLSKGLNPAVIRT